MIDVISFQVIDDEQARRVSRGSQRLPLPVN